MRASMKFASAILTALLLTASVSDRDVLLLARLVEAEARNRSWPEMTALAEEAVISLKSGRFDTLAGVIFEYGAYKSVADGRIFEREPSALSRQAAYDALTRG